MPTLNRHNLHFFGLRLARLCRRRTQAAIERYPMVGLFGITATFVAMEPRLGTALSNGLLVLTALLLAYWLGSICLRKRTIGPVWKVATLCIAVAALFVFVQNGTRRIAEDNKARIQERWDLARRESSGLAWEPIALRGTIEQSVSLRPSMSTKSTEVSMPPSADPLQTDDGQSWMSTSVIRVEQIREKQSWQPAEFLVPFSVLGRIEWLPGDRVEVYGRWKLPSVATNPGQRDPTDFFTSRGYDFQLRIDSPEKLKSWETPNRFRLDRWLSKLRNVAIDSMEANVPFGMSHLACALILGQRDMASWALQEELLATGTIHMLAISGLHIEMIASALLFLGALARFPNKRLLAIVCLIVWGYALLCGAKPPVMRAAIMLSLAYFAKLLGWQFSSLNNLATTALILMAYQPGILFDVGPQLSFIAVAVLILSSENLTKRQTALMSLIKAREGRRMRIYRAVLDWMFSALRTSFWVWMITLPIVWNGFHVMSPVSVLLNLLLWFPVMISLVSGLAMIIVGWIPLVGNVLGFMCGLPLWFVKQLVDVGESIPFGHFWGPSPPVAWVYGFYGIALVLMIYSGRRRAFSRSGLLYVLLIWMGIGIAYNPVSKSLHRLFSSDRDLVVTFIDVGHGTNAWIETPDGELWLYDAGRLGDQERSYRRIADALWYDKHATINRMLLSHADSDHYNGMKGLLKRFSIKAFTTTPQVMSHPSESLGRLLSAVAERRIPAETWQAGDKVEQPDWAVRVLHPPESLTSVSDNASSLCLLFEYAGRRILLPGDLEPPGVQMVVESPAIPIDLIMAPHHGSLNAKASLLVDWCTPKVILISCSDRINTKRALQYFAGDEREILLTSRDHALRAIIARDGSLTLQTWQDGRWVTTKSLDK